MRPFVLLVLLVAVAVAQETDPTTTEAPMIDDEPTTEMSEREEKAIMLEPMTTPAPTTSSFVPISRASRMFFGGLFQFPFGSRCSSPNPVCPINCSTDPAVVHGYCCGCRQSLFGFDYPPPITCPAFLTCPPPEPLCSDYRYVMDCCCGAGIAFFP